MQKGFSSIANSNWNGGWGRGKNTKNILINKKTSSLTRTHLRTFQTEIPHSHHHFSMFKHKTNWRFPQLNFKYLTWLEYIQHTHTAIKFVHMVFGVWCSILYYSVLCPNFIHNHIEHFRLQIDWFISLVMNHRCITIYLVSFFFLSPMKDYNTTFWIRVWLGECYWVASTNFRTEIRLEFFSFPNFNQINW